MLAFFFSPEKEHPLRTTLMTSSKRHRGQRAVSHLVLYSNLKKKRQSNRDTRGRGSRGKRTSDRNKDVNFEEAVQVMVLGLNWPTHLGCCEVHPWVGGGMVGWAMVWAHRLSENSLCRSMFVCEVKSLSPSPAGPPLCQSAGSHLVSPDFPRPWTSDRNSLLSFLIGTCMKWVRWGGRLQCPLLFGRLLTEAASIHSVCGRVGSFLWKVDALKPSEWSTSWECKDALRAQSRLLWRRQRVFFTLLIVVIFLFVVIIRIVYQAH